MQALGWLRGGGCYGQLQTEVQTVSNVPPVQVPTVAALTLLRHSLRPESPLFLTTNHFPKPPLPLPHCGSALRDMQPCIGSQCVWGRDCAIRDQYYP